METEQVLPFSAVSVVEDVLQQHGAKLTDFYFASRKTEEACIYPFPFLQFIIFAYFFFDFSFIDHKKGTNC